MGIKRLVRKRNTRRFHSLKIFDCHTHYYMLLRNMFLLAFMFLIIVAISDLVMVSTSSKNSSDDVHCHRSNCLLKHGAKHPYAPMNERVCRLLDEGPTYLVPPLLQQSVMVLQLPLSTLLCSHSATWFRVFLLLTTCNRDAVISEVTTHQRLTIRFVRASMEDSRAVCGFIDRDKELDEGANFSTILYFLNRPMPRRRFFCGGPFDGLFFELIPPETCQPTGMSRCAPSSKDATRANSPVWI
jgi:hypothetical protein